MARADHPQPVAGGSPREGSSPRASVVPLVSRAPGGEPSELIAGLTRIAEDSLAAHRRFVAEAPALLAPIVTALADALGAGGKVLFCGNGGSAADAQHVAGELMGRFLIEREPWPAIALTTDTSILTAVGNDWTFEDVFARQVRALARPGDVVVGISTS
ncbi:MAG: SIS domain-containing protein, partial [Deltaproteobacteria bacterium]|nr:SIS domain-containing protein [Deltaproteobacteria bacterium]